MKSPLDPVQNFGPFPYLRHLVPMHSLLLAFVLCVSGQANAAAPDLTAGGVPNDSDQWNIGLAAGSGDDTPLNTSQFNNVTVTP